MTMRNIKLYGHLGKRFGRIFRMDVNSVAEAVAALKANLQGFEAYLATHSMPGYHIFIGKRNLGEDELALPGGAGDIKFVPVVAGAKRAGMFQTIFGIALIVVGVFTSWAGGTALISAGVSMVIGGVTQLLTVQPGQANREKPENRPSYAFNGPVNTTAQGNPVPVCYGEVMVGSQVASFGLSVDDILVNDPYSGGGGTGYGDGEYEYIP